MEMKILNINKIVMVAKFHLRNFKCDRFKDSSWLKMKQQNDLSK